MSVIVELQVSAQDFEFGRVFSGMDVSVTIELESLVPIPGTSLPFVWISGENHDSLGDPLVSHPTICEVEKIESLSDRTLYALDWSVEYDHLFRQLREQSVQILGAGSTTGVWRFTLRFWTHQALSQFQDCCEDAQIDLDVSKVYNMPEARQGQDWGLTQPQREALTLAVREGYYDLPRGCNTADLGEWLDISDQAVTERLRRAIATLTRNTLMAENY